MNKKKWIHFFWQLVIVALVGGIGAVTTGDSQGVYASLIKPAYAPPGWAFPLVWTVLYVLMAVSATLVWNGTGSKEERRQAMGIYGVSLFFNFVWPQVFFNLQSYLAAFLILLLLWLSVLMTIWAYEKSSKTGAWLQIPYLLWVSFAGYLNFAIWQLNP